MEQLKTPVALLIFNRPDTTGQVFARIRQARPRQLLVVADGPRLNRTGEAAACAAARAIIDEVDWPCDVQTNYSAVNLGCKRRVSSGLDWVFQTVEEAIILEDDCVPHPSFFRYCAELLDRYRDDERVMHIGGSNFQFGRRQGSASYYFSRYAHVWGWASWRRAWQHYDVSLGNWPAVRTTLLKQFEQAREAEFWRLTLDRVALGEIDTWDYQWALACMARKGLAAVPNVNLVTNIGFGASATHTTAQSKLANMPVLALDSPLLHPQQVKRVSAADERVRRLFFDRSSLIARIASKVGEIRTAMARKNQWNAP